MSISVNPIREHLDYVLRKFCKTEVWQDELKYQLAPFRCQGFCVAADTHFMLAIDEHTFPFSPTDYPEHDTPLVTKIYEMMRAMPDLEAYSVDDLEAVCNECAKLNEQENNDYANVIYLAPDAFSVKIIRRVILAARLLGASTIIVPAANEAGNMRFFSVVGSKANSCAHGIFMPIRPDNDYHLHSVQQSIFVEDTGDINLEAGMKFRADMEAAEEQARKEYEASKKVWRVQVVKSAWIPVQAVTAEEAMRLAQEHNSGVDDEMFEDSDVSVEACESYPMDDEDVAALQDDRDSNRQGILTSDGWKSWSAYYGEDDPEDEYHKSTTSVKVTFGK